MKEIGRLFWSSVYLLKSFKLGLMAMRNEQIGSQVIYKGRKVQICNWAGTSHPTLADGNGFYEEYVPRDQIQNVCNLSELFHRFNTTRKWYLLCWFRIDVENRLNSAR